MPTGSFVPSGPFSRNTWRGIESLPGQLLNNLGRLGSYLGSPQAAQDYTNLLRGSIPGRVGSIPPSANGESYRDAELRLGNRGGSGGNAGYSTSTFVAPGAAQGGGFGGGGQYQDAGSFAPIDPYAAQNREYERERARVEAMVKANPDMQKQAIADERAKVRDQGMAIWAAKYGGPGGLASKVKPGAVGYDAIQRGIGIRSMQAQSKTSAELLVGTNATARHIDTRRTSWQTHNVEPFSTVLVLLAEKRPPPVNFNPLDPGFENMSPEEFQELLKLNTSSVDSWHCSACKPNLLDTNL
jgi:hypothetical protein